MIHKSSTICCAVHSSVLTRWQHVIEPHSLCTSGGKRPVGITQVPWKRSWSLAWDKTCSNTYAASYVQASSILAGSAAAAAEVKKAQKYADIIAGIDFVPFAIETSHGLRAKAISQHCSWKNFLHVHVSLNKNKFLSFYNTRSDMHL